MKLYEYVIRRLVLMVFVLLAVSVIVFVITRGVPSPTYALAPYITPRMTDPQKLQTAVGLGIAEPSCPSWVDFTQSAPGCITPLYVQYFSWLKQVLSGNWGNSVIPSIGVGQSTWASSSLDFRTQRSWRLPPRSSLYSLHFRWV